MYLVFSWEYDKNDEQHNLVSMGYETLDQVPLDKPFAKSLDAFNRDHTSVLVVEGHVVNVKLTISEEKGQ